MTKIEDIADNEYYLVVTGWHQYAEGVTGINRMGFVYANCWSRKTEAKEALKVAKAKYKRQKGVSNGYGDVGAREYTFNVLTGAQIKVALKNELRYYIRGWDNLKETI